MTALPLLVALLVFALIFAAFYRYYGERARRYSYPSRSSYMRAVPKCEMEKQEAVDQTFLGLAICLVGFLMPPIILIGITPLVVGGRKTAYVMMGLGYLDDKDLPGA